MAPMWCIPQGRSAPAISATAFGSCGRGRSIAAADARPCGRGRFAAVNFLNPERRIVETAAGKALAWNSVTTGNLAGVDLWLDAARTGSLNIETNIVSGDIDLSTLSDDIVAFAGGGLGRRLSVY